MGKLHAAKLKFAAHITICFAVALFVLPSLRLLPTVSAAVNQEISFQGKIVDKTAGTNISPGCIIAGANNDTCDVRASIYADSSGGTALWSEIHTDVELGAYNGLLSINIGSYCITNQGGSWTTDGDGGGSRCTVSGGGIDWGDDDTLYLQIDFDIANTSGVNSFSSPETFTRKLISSVPYALRADTVDGIDSSGLVQLAPDTVQTTSDTDSLINLETTANTSNALLRLVENGAGTPNFIRLIQGSTDQFIVSNSGDVQMIAGAQIQSLTNAVQGIQIANASGVAFVNFDTLNQRVGVGNSAPVTALDVTGTAKIGGFNEATAGTCNGTVEGAMFYDTTDDAYNYCNGTTWVTMTSGLSVTTKTIQNRTVLCTKTLGSAGTFDTTTDCGGLSSDYSHLEITVKGRSTSTTPNPDTLMLYYNNDTTATNYRSTYGYATDATAAATEADNGAIGTLTYNSAPANAFSINRIYIPRYNDSVFKAAYGESSTPMTASSDRAAMASHYWENTAAITRILIRALNGTSNNLLTGSYFELVGIKEELVVTGVTNGVAGGSAPVFVNTATTSTGLDIVYTGTGTTTDAIKVVNSSTGVITDGIDLSDAEIVNAINLGSNNIVMDNDGTVNWNDSAGNNLIEIKDLSTNFGATVEAGAFISRNSYFGEEFSRERANLTVDTTQAWGDQSAWTVDEQADSTNDCAFSIVDDVANGISRMQNDDANTTCMMYLGAAVGDLHTTFDADNLPVIVMKVRPSNVGTDDDFWVGLGDTIDLTGPTDMPNGIYFTNADGNTWTGRTSTTTDTDVVCTGQTISTTQFALLKIEVKTNTDVRFYVDNDVSNGVSWTYCGQSTSNIPVIPLAAFMKHSSTTVTRRLDVDYFRVWQDDNIQSENNPVSTPNDNGDVAGVDTSDDQVDAPPSNVNQDEVPEPPVNTPNSIAEQPIIRLDGTKILINKSGVNEIKLDAARTINVGDMLIHGKVEVGGDLFTKGNVSIGGALYISSNSTGSKMVSAEAPEQEVIYAKPRTKVPNVLISLANNSVFRYEITESTQNGFKFKVYFKESALNQNVQVNWLVIDKLD